MSLKPCPFCNGNAELKQDNWDNPNAGYGGQYGYAVFCKACGSKSATEYYKCFSHFSKYSVEDFRKSTLLRAQEDEKYQAYVDEHKYKASKKWNVRYKPTVYGGECGAKDHV